MENLLNEIKDCRACAASLPHGPRPVLQASPSAQLLIAGQAPGRIVHESGVPFDDLSGDRLRAWLGVSRETFYDAHKVAVVPMGFCYPGTGRSGDLPPRPECAPLWQARLMASMKEIQLKIIIGRYAIDHYMPGCRGEPITSVVKNYDKHPKNTVVLPHPSPRNNIWLKKNGWFEKDVIPDLQSRVREVLGCT